MKIIDKVVCLNTKDDEKEPNQQDRVYSKNGIMTAIYSQLSGRFNIVEETKVIGGIYTNVSDDFQRGMADGLSRTLKSGSADAGVVERIIVAQRGRNPDNPSDGTAGIPTEQRLEPNNQKTCNTLTSVQKDNLVIERKIMTPKRNAYGKVMRKEYESGKLKESRHNMTQIEPRQDGMTNTLTTVQKDNLVMEKIVQLPYGDPDSGVRDAAPTIAINSYQDNNLELCSENSYLDENNFNQRQTVHPRNGILKYSQVSRHNFKQFFIGDRKLLLSPISRFLFVRCQITQ